MRCSLRLVQRGISTIFTYKENRAEAEKVVALATQAGAGQGRKPLDDRHDISCKRHRIGPSGSCPV